MDTSIIASRIKDLRTSLDLTQTDFAASISTTQAALSGYERGDRVPSIETLITITEIYNVSLDWLCGISERKNFSSKPETYSDLIQILMDLKNTDDICLHWNLEKCVSDTPFTVPTHYKLKCEFDDKYLVEFYEEWQDILSVCKKSPSGEKLYNIWLKDILERYNFKLEYAYQDPSNELLPFN